jgi:uncharacterized membrane protein YheB (UPF0754 family)
MNHKLVVDLITVPLFTGIIGYITNWTGVLMLFKPIRFYGMKVPLLRVLFPFLPRRVQVLPAIRYDGYFGWQGIVPSRADKMASIAVDKGLSKLGGIGDFYRELEPDKMAEHLAHIADLHIEEIVERIMTAENPQLWNELPPRMKEVAIARVRSQLPKMVATMTDEIGENVDQLIDAKLMVVRYLVSRPDLLNQMFQEMGRKELRFMQNFGFYFGYPMGFVLVAILHAYPQWWVLPVGGVVIGWVVNYIGIAMIFEPVERSWWCPWRQGLFIKRKSEITETYARMIADNVITLENIGNELLTGPRSDRTMQMFEETLRPVVDKSVGPLLPAVKLAVGARSYERIAGSVALEATNLAPVAFAEPAFNKQQSGRIYDFISRQMRAMNEHDFVELLRSAIKQDEWLLFVHGGVLGLFAGFLHLAIFGV